MRHGHVQHFANNRSACYFYKYDMIQPNTIEAVEKSETALNLMGFDHTLQQVLDGKFLSLPRKIICNSENSTQIVGRMAPYSLKWCQVSRVE
jgi:hypothetical protein